MSTSNRDPGKTVTVDTPELRAAFEADNWMHGKPLEALAKREGRTYAQLERYWHRQRAKLGIKFVRGGPKVEGQPTRKKRDWKSSRAMKARKLREARAAASTSTFKQTSKARPVESEARALRSNRPTRFFEDEDAEGEEEEESYYYDHNDDLEDEKEETESDLTDLEDLEMEDDSESAQEEDSIVEDEKTLSPPTEEQSEQMDMTLVDDTRQSSKKIVVEEASEELQAPAREAGLPAGEAEAEDDDNEEVDGSSRPSSPIYVSASLPAPFSYTAPFGRPRIPVAAANRPPAPAQAPASLPSATAPGPITRSTYARGRGCTLLPKSIRRSDEHSPDSPASFPMTAPLESSRNSTSTRRTSDSYHGSVGIKRASSSRARNSLPSDSAPAPTPLSHASESSRALRPSVQRSRVRGVGPAQHQASKTPQLDFSLSPAAGPLTATRARGIRLSRTSVSTQTTPPRRVRAAGPSLNWKEAMSQVLPPASDSNNAEKFFVEVNLGLIQPTVDDASSSQLPREMQDWVKRHLGPTSATSPFPSSSSSTQQHRSSGAVTRPALVSLSAQTARSFSGEAHGDLSSTTKRYRAADPTSLSRTRARTTPSLPLSRSNNYCHKAWNQADKPVNADFVNHTRAQTAFATSINTYNDDGSASPMLMGSFPLSPVPSAAGQRGARHCNEGLLALSQCALRGRGESSISSASSLYPSYATQAGSYSSLASTSSSPLKIADDCYVVPENEQEREARLIAASHLAHFAESGGSVSHQRREPTSLDFLDGSNGMFTSMLLQSTAPTSLSSINAEPYHHPFFLGFHSAPPAPMRFDAGEDWSADARLAVPPMVAPLTPFSAYTHLDTSSTPPRERQSSHEQPGFPVGYPHEYACGQTGPTDIIYDNARHLSVFDQSASLCQQLWPIP